MGKYDNQGIKISRVKEHHITICNLRLGLLPVYISLTWDLYLKFDASALNKQAGSLEYREVFYSFNVRKRLYGGAA